MNKEQEIVLLKELREKLDRKDMFTALDLSNDVKLGGTWISHPNVSGFMKNLRDNSVLDSYDYIYRLIEVEGELKTYLYYSLDSDYKEYINKSQKAISFIDFNFKGIEQL